MSQPATHDQDNRTRNGNGSYRRDLEHVERDAEACRLASMGWSYSKIAAELGYADKGAAYRGVQKVLVETARSHGTETLRQQQLTGLRPSPDEACWLLAGVGERAPAGDETVQRCARSWTARSG